MQPQEPIAKNISFYLHRKVSSGIDSMITCPLSKQPMIDPVFAMDGYTYERNEIQRYLNKYKTSPITKQSLHEKLQLIPNRNLKKFIIQMQGRQNQFQSEQTSTSQQKNMFQRQKVPFQYGEPMSQSIPVQSKAQKPLDLDKIKNSKNQQNLKYFPTQKLDKFAKKLDLKLARLNPIIFNAEKDKVFSLSKGKPIQYQNGKYLGAFNKQKRSGRAIYQFNNGDIYIGSYEDDSRHGNGKYYWVNGDVYQGQFAYGKKCGKGVMQWADGSYYQGTFDQDLKHGSGKFKWGEMTLEAKQAGNEYQGHFNKDKREGYGILKHLNGDRYQGQFLNNKFHGLGKLTSNGSVFEGYFQEGQFIGKQKSTHSPHKIKQGSLQQESRSSRSRPDLGGDKFQNFSGLRLAKSVQNAYLSDILKNKKSQNKEGVQKHMHYQYGTMQKRNPNS